MRPGEAIGSGVASSMPSRSCRSGRGLGGKHVHSRSLEAEIGIEALAEPVEAQAR